MKNILFKTTDIRFKNLPYKTNSEFNEDILFLTSLKLYMFIVSENKSIDNIYNYNNNDILNMEYYINKRISKTNNIYENIALFKLKKIFNLNNTQINIILIGFLYSVNENYDKIFSLIGKNNTIPTLYIVKALYKSSTADILDSFNDNFINIFLDISIYKYDTLLLAPILLNNDILYFLLSNTYKADSSLNYIYYINKPFDDKLSIYNKIIEDNIISIIEKNTSQNFCLNIIGKKGIGKKYHVNKICLKLNKNIIFVNIGNLLQYDIAKIKYIVYHIFRMSIFSNSFIAIYNLNNLVKEYTTDNIIKTFITNNSFIFVLLEDKHDYNLTKTKYLSFNFEISNYSVDDIYKLWLYYSKCYNLEDNINFYELANKFILTPKSIKDAIENAKIISSSNNNKFINISQLTKSCYQEASDILKQKATLVKSSYTLNDLIIPSDQKAQMIHACNHIKLKHIVYDKWEFNKRLSYGKGLNILFAGPPGTGKTMAAQVIANELSLQMYSVDLSQIVSKYIGETEDNLRQIFDEAQKSNVILFIDEMDALFSKRSEVKDSHDKYSNMETSFLLQKIESYEGIVLLATNYLTNIDEAFVRRINFIIHFPFPDKKHRKDIWMNMFPDNSPIDDSVDFDFLAENFEIAGGNIKNIVLKAAFMAASENCNITMKHLILSTKDELSKQGKILLKQDFKNYSYYIN